jgi:mRNA interferase MazF
MNRGDLVVVSAPGHFGKPRPALVVQSDLFNPTHASVVVCLLTTDLTDAPLIRLDVEPTPHNGLRQQSQIIIDKVLALRRERIGARIGRLDSDALVRVNRSLALLLGLGD